MQALLSEVEQSVTDEISRVKRDGLDIKVDLPPCPNCADGHLRQRTSESGKFWGCTNYPDCKATFPDKRGKPDLERQKENNSEQRTSMPSMRQGVDTPPLGQRQEEILVELFRFPGL